MSCQHTTKHQMFWGDKTTPPNSFQIETKSCRSHPFIDENNNKRAYFLSVSLILIQSVHRWSKMHWMWKLWNKLKIGAILCLPSPRVFGWIMNAKFRHLVWWRSIQWRKNETSGLFAICFFSPSFLCVDTMHGNFTN